MYAPVAVRFFIYDIPLDGAERDYMHSVIMHPAVQHWLEAATLEHPGGEASLERTQEVAVAASADAAPATSIAAAADAIKARAAPTQVSSFQSHGRAPGRKRVG